MRSVRSTAKHGRLPTPTRPRAPAGAALALLASALAGCGSSGSRLTSAQLRDPAACKTCHPDHYDEWSRSMHAYASEDPVFLAMNRRGQRETGGQLGAFCIRCHAPMAFLNKTSTDGLDLAGLPASERGITCFYCHSVDKVTGTHDAALELASDGVLRGGIADPVANPAHTAKYSALHDREMLDSAGLCGSCHDIVSPQGDALERTYEEWSHSVFADKSNPGALSCGKCHMDGRQDVAAKNVPGNVHLALRTVHSHAFPGVDVALTDFPGKAEATAEVKNVLGQALQALLCVEDPPTPRIFVVLDNAGTGHKFPSGATQDRRLWVELIAYKDSRVLYQSGVVADGAAVEKVADPDLWLIRDCIFDASNKPVDMFWQAALSTSNQLPAPVTNKNTDPQFLLTHVPYRFAATSSGTAALTDYPDRVTMRVRMQPIGRAVLDDLVASHDLDPAVPPLEPTFDLPIVGLSGTTLTWTATAAVPDRTFQAGFGGLRCVSPSNLRGPVDGEPQTASHVTCRRP